METRSMTLSADSQLMPKFFSLLLKRLIARVGKMSAPMLIGLTFVFVVMNGVTGQRCVAEDPRNAESVKSPVRDDSRQLKLHVQSWREIQRANVVMQERDYSCGAAALATILRYHWSDDVTETQVLVRAASLLTPEELKDRIENGLSLTDLRNVAIKMGYLSTIGKLEFDKLKESKIPLLVGIVVNEYDHFVVFRGTDGFWVYLADPARGNIRIRAEEFQQQWQKNAVLVVVKKGVEAERNSPLRLQALEAQLGNTSRKFLVDQVGTVDRSPPR